MVTLFFPLIRKHLPTVIEVQGALDKAFNIYGNRKKCMANPIQKGQMKSLFNFYFHSYFPVLENY